MDGVCDQRHSGTALVDATAPAARSLTFDWLRRHTSLLADALQRHASPRQAVVGLLSERSAEQVCGVFAIWRAGGVYLPLDPTDPESRLACVVEDARPAALLVAAACEAATSRLHTVGVPRVQLESGRLLGATSSSLAENGRTLPEGESTTRSTTGSAHSAGGCRRLMAGCCYLLYTSGSTGESKGVLGSRAGLEARCSWMWEAYPFAPDEVCVAKTPLGFVDSLWEMVGPLAKGVPLLLLPSDAASRPHALLPVLREWRASRLVLVPSALRMLLDACEACDGGTLSTPPAPPPPPPSVRVARPFSEPSRAFSEPSRNLLPSLRVLSVSGDALPWALCVRAAALLPHVRLLNLYGCTETSADATAFDVTAAMARGSSDGGGGGGGIGVGICPLGAPIRGAHVWLLRAAPAEADGDGGGGDGGGGDGGGGGGGDGGGG